MKKRFRLLALVLAITVLLSTAALKPFTAYADEGGGGGSSDSGSSGGGGGDSGGGGGGGSDSGSGGGGGSDSGSGGGDSGGGGGSDSGSGGGDSGSGGGGGDSGSGGGGGDSGSGGGDSGSGGGDSGGGSTVKVGDDINWFPVFPLSNYYTDPKPEADVETRIHYVSAEEMPAFETIEGAALSFTTDRISMPYLGQTDLNLYIAEAYPSVEDIVWESADPTIVKVDEYGVITGVTMGDCWVLANIGTLQKRIFVNVEENTAVKQTEEFPFELRINRSYNNVTVYALDKNGEYTIPYKTFRCSGGYRSPIGTQHIQGKYEWNILGEHWGHFCAWICHGYMLHSIPIWGYGRDDRVDYNMIYQFGTTASAGCIRIEIVNAKWIYMNLPVGTTVEYYFDVEDPGPLGRNEVVIMPNAKCLWEPTNPDPANPWLEGEPAIEGVKDLTVSRGAEVDFFSHVVCTDSRGNSIPENLKITTSLDTSTPGTYPVIYALTDATYRTAYAYCYVTVT